MEGDLNNQRIKLWGQKFLSTPSGWRATTSKFNGLMKSEIISIHALRVEGDSIIVKVDALTDISIHALRVEGDRTRIFCAAAQHISIHALRVEGDSAVGV